jgi:GGDEF domain-containing protein
VRAFSKKEQKVNRRQGSEEKDIQRIREYLANPEVQERILASMQDVWDKAAVTTRVAATIFDLGEQRLRDWENRGFLQGRRTANVASQKGKTGRSHRQFTFNELTKLAILKELVDVGDFNFGSIPHNVEEIWNEVTATQEKQPAPANIPADAFAPINQRIDTARTKLLWRFFATQALRFALLLLAEDMPGEAVGLVFPLGKEFRKIVIQKVDDLPLLGESLVGWLTRSRSMHALLTPRPSFEVPLDFRLLPLVAMRNDEPTEELPEENMYVIIPRRSKKLTLSAETIQTIRALLRPLCSHAEEIRNCFGPNMYDVLDPAPDITQSEIYPDLILNGLADIIVELGGKVGEENRWRFCCILLPKDSSLPLYQRSLTVQAQSRFSPHKIGFASVSPGVDDNSLSLRAYQSGQISYRDEVPPDSSAVAFRDIEHPINSAIAVPVGSESGIPTAVLYVTSQYEAQFSSPLDRRLLRLISRMVDELIKIYEVRRSEAQNLINLMRFPDVADAFLGKFPSEGDFVRDLDAILTAYKASREEHSIGLIGIDVDHVGKLALKYGDLAVRNLCEAIGQRIQGELASTFRKYPDCKFYHIYADRFYLIIQKISYDEVIQKARLLKKSLDGTYRLSIFSPTDGQPPVADTLQKLEITVRLAISYYENKKTFDELFELYLNDTAVYNVREMIEKSLDTELKKGMAEGGDNIRAYIPDTRIYQKISNE